MVSVLLKFIFLDRNNLIGIDEAFYSLPGYHFLTTGSNGIKEIGGIAGIGEHYSISGELLDYMQAAVFWLVGMTPFSIRLIPFLCYLASAFVVFRICIIRFNGGVAVAAALLFLAVPTAAYRIVARPEIIQLTIMLLCAGYFISLKPPVSRGQFFIFGMLSSVSVWIHSISALMVLCFVLLVTLINFGVRKLLIVFLGISTGIFLYLLFFVLPRWDHICAQWYEFIFVLVDSSMLPSGTRVMDYLLNRFMSIAEFIVNPKYMVFLLAGFIAALFSYRGNQDFYRKIFVPMVVSVVICSLVPSRSGYWYMGNIIPLLSIPFALLLSRAHFSIVPVVFALVVIQSVVSYVRSDTSLQELSRDVESYMKGKGAVLAPLPYNIVWQRRDFYGSYYFLFYDSIRKRQPKLLSKYAGLYGDSFRDFVFDRGIRYVVIDMNGPGEIVEEMQGYVKEIASIKSPFGGVEGKVRVYEVIRE